MTAQAIEVLGIVAIATMVISYAYEKRDRMFIAIFAVGCALAAVYAYLIESYPFLVAEGTWSMIAFKRWHAARRRS